jgi:hypothetical protein
MKRTNSVQLCQSDVFRLSAIVLLIAVLPVFGLGQRSF